MTVISLEPFLDKDHDYTPEEIDFVPLVPADGWHMPRHEVVISIAVHLLILFLMIFAWPHQRPLGMPVERPIAITMMQQPDIAETADTSSPASGSGAVSPKLESDVAALKETEAPPQQTPVQQPRQSPIPPVLNQQTQAPEQASSEDPVISEAQPYDPNFNPLASETVSPKPSDTPPAPVPNVQPSALVADSSTQANAPGAGQAYDPNDAQIGDMSAGPNAPPSAMPGGQQVGGNPADRSGNGDPRMHPQFLRVRLGSDISARYVPQLQNFLIRLIGCGVHPMQVRNPQLSVEADVSFAPNGMMRFATLTNNGDFGSDTDYTAASDRLMKALSNPGCTRMDLPLLTYPAWREVHVSFFQHY